MDHVYTVVKQTILEAPVDEAWKRLVDGKLISAWFADSGDLAPGGPFRFEFGDGDYFSGVVTEWDPPVTLGLEWRFMDVGPRFDIRCSLLPLENRTVLSIQDRGSASVAEAVGLWEGWEDFLMRCERFIRTKEKCRYRWTEVLGATALVNRVDEAWQEMTDGGALRRFFPGAEIAMRENGEQRLCLEFQDPAWNGLRTSGQATLNCRLGETCLSVSHRGWEALPAETQVAERKRYAEAWGSLLKHIESTYYVTKT